MIAPYPSRWTNARARSPRLLELILLLSLLLTSGCTEPVVRKYYTLNPPSVTQAAKAFDHDLWVREVDIAPVYNRAQIVYRFSENELQYYREQTWADRPQRMVTGMLVKAMAGTGLFRTVSDRLGTSPPTLVLEATVDAIEELDGGDVWYAHLSMSLRLLRFSDNRVLWTGSFDERRALLRKDVSLAVRALSEIFQEEMDRLLPELDAVLAGRPLPPRGPTRVPPPVSPEQPVEKPDGASSQVMIDSQNPRVLAEIEEWRRSAQFASDPTRLPPGKGAIFLPSLCQDSEREPTVQIFQGELEVGAGSMGRRIPLPPGTYDVSFGSGSLSQRLSRTLQVEEGRVTIQAPDWAVLDVSVVDDKFIPFRGSYELINMDTLELVGTGYGAVEELGEVTQTWVLQPGLYKLVQPGSNYRARTNFATVQLQPGTFTPFNLVLDPDTRNFLGAGVAELDASGPISEKRWLFRSTLGGDLLWAHRSEGLGAQAGTSLTVSGFADNQLRYRQARNLWTTRLEVEEGLSVLESTNEEGESPGLRDARFQVIRDRLYLNSVYIYELLKWAGPYARVGAETTLLYHYQYFTEPTDLIILDDTGAQETSYNQAESLLVSPPFSPLDLKQGAGINFRLVHNTFLDLDLRTGLGARQYLPRGLLTAADSSGTSQLEYQRASTTLDIGPEVTLLANARLTRYIQCTTELDALLPQTGMEDTRFTWRSAISLRLGSYASLVYTLNLDRNPKARELQPLVSEQTVQLRFTWNPLGT